MQRQSGLKIMKRLMGELRYLTPIMCITISMGVLGFLASIAITAFGAVAVGVLVGEITFISFKVTLLVMGVCAILRGFLRYIEQLSGHYIAFKILAILRDKVFTALRRLAPAKLEGKEKGHLIAMITADIELLEVFYAHTIAPICIAVITNGIMSYILFKIHPLFGVIGMIFFVVVGAVIPYGASVYGKQAGVMYRQVFAKTNTYLLDSLRGLKEILLFRNNKVRLHRLNENSKRLNKSQAKIKAHEGIVRALSDLMVISAIIMTVYVGMELYRYGNINFTQYFLAIVIVASSFGPVVALSNLSNTLLQTFACAQRVFNLLDEEPEVYEILGEETATSKEITYQQVSFQYKNRNGVLLKDVSLMIHKGEKIALIGESGIGKSTFIKLLMRFFDVTQGAIEIDGKNLKQIPTKELRNIQTLVSQDTFLFDETIEQNIKLAKADATREEVIAAAKKASIHQFITTLPKGYDTRVGELGKGVSSGEKQRIGLARAFLRESQILILDEPTSNLDTLNEAEILKAIKENCQDQTIVLISHRKSTTGICERIYKLHGGKVSLEQS